MKAITRLYVALLACFISSDVLAQPPADDDIDD